MIALKNITLFAILILRTILENIKITYIYHTKDLKNYYFHQEVMKQLS